MKSPKGVATQTVPEGVHSVTAEPGDIVFLKGTSGGRRALSNAVMHNGSAGDRFVETFAW